MLRIRLSLAVLGLSLFSPGCVRARADALSESPTSDAAAAVPSEACARAEGFDTLTGLAALEGLASAAEADLPWLRRWHQVMLAGVDAARRRHDAVALQGCKLAQGDPVVLTAYQGCLERAVIRLDAQLSVAAELVADEPQALSLVPAWGRALEHGFDACSADPHRRAAGSLAAAELEAQARTGLETLERAWARAGFGDYDEAQQLLERGREAVRRGGDAASVFSMHLLEGYLALAEAELGRAEAALAPAAALAKQLGPEAAMNLAFFRGTTATLAGDDAGARRAFSAAARSAQLMVDAGAGSLAVEASEATLRAAQAAWREGDEGAREQLRGAWGAARAVLSEDDPRRLDYLDAAAQMGLQLEGAAQSESAIMKGLGPDWPRMP